jgi:ATP-binding cassette subfamily B protein
MGPYDLGPMQDSRAEPDRPGIAGGMRWALAFAWRSRPGLCATLLGGLVMESLVPAGTAVLLGSFAGEIQETLSTPAHGYQRALVFLGAALVVAGIGSLARVVANYARYRLNDELQADLSIALFDHAARLDLWSFENAEVQDRLARAHDLPRRHFLRFLTAVLDSGRFVVGGAALLAVMLAIEPWWTPLLGLVALPFLFHRRKLARERSELERAHTTKQRWNAYFLSLVAGREAVATTRVLGLAPYLRERFESSLRQITEASRRLHRRQAVGRSVGSLLFLAAIGVLLFVVLERSSAGELEAGPLAAYAFAALRLRREADSLSQSLSELMEGALHVGSLPELLRTEPQVKDRPAALTPPIRGRIELEQVTFFYPGAERPALDRVSMCIEPGETVALVGHNGSGKTTLAKLIARLYDPTSGRVLVDGEDLRQLSLDHWHASLGLVVEHPVAFEGTAHENIALGDWRRLIGDRAGVLEAAERARVRDMIESLPRGFDTQLGRGFGQVSLSTGQWQRLAVARVLARRPAVLLLDEPTANLDVFAELELFSALREVAAGTTTIFISHRFSTVQMADRILVLEEGRLVEQGSHRDLLRAGGLYASLHRLHGAAIGTEPAEAVVGDRPAR